MNKSEWQQFTEDNEKDLAYFRKRQRRTVRFFLLAVFVLLLAIIWSLSGYAQTEKKFKTTSWGQTNWGYYYRPATPGKYPVVIFFHGSGEVGTDSVSAKSLLNFGPLNFIKSGWRPNLVIFAIQVSYWSPTPDLCKFILDNDPDINPFWDLHNTLWTGLSAGGERVLEAMSAQYPGSFCPMSPAALDFSKINFAIPFRVWDFHADNDAVCPYQYSVDLIARLNAAYPGSGQLTTYHGGHGGWNTFYDPAMVPNIYDWSLQGAPPAKTVLSVITVYTDGSTVTKVNQ